MKQNKSISFSHCYIYALTTENNATTFIVRMSEVEWNEGPRPQKISSRSVSLQEELRNVSPFGS